ncbi:hypothetical protein [Thalassospira sp.]|uniref:hypothetical protein n=1 Tax=Thalassospira sp. TaxID=1912094 RepID=UPI000C3DB064|nr:hypothetical protein [Thalassospira sp.]MBC07666.1 hypothetical protein [Thalassospira sp.]|tara:strand:+ start:4981 stop:5163 length:183 start_codon:yes stop_codon:yes gene_type:complete
MAKPSVSNGDQPDMLKQSLLMMAVNSLVGAVGLFAMMHWPLATSVVLIVLLVLLLAGGRS